jgi:hypothetical protein
MGNTIDGKLEAVSSNTKQIPIALYQGNLPIAGVDIGWAPSS